LAKRREQRIRARKARTFRRRMMALVVIVVVVSALGLIYYFGNKVNSKSSESNKVLLRTSMGDITIQLYDDMPITTGNFKNLVKRGVYDNTIFHRVIVDFMIQGGDPTGTGYGDPSIPTIPDEFTDHNRNDRGTIAMANAGPNTGSSQFFINLVNNNYLDTKHPVFGRVIAGMDVVDAIGNVATGQNDRPLQDVRIIKAELI
jgi:peptidylprolyl isomerase